MKFFAIHKYARSSPKKLRIVSKLLVKKKVSEAIKILSYNQKKSFFLIKKVLESALSNAENNHNIHIDELLVQNIIINPGPSLKRSIARAKGKMDKILKRTSHIVVIISKKINGEKHGSKS